jgi:two-component system, OmpR family, response regulator
MPKNVKKVRIFSALEVANLCGVVNQTAINWIRNGYLKAFTTPGGKYRIYAEDLTAFLEKRGMRIPPELGDHFKEDVEWTTLLIVDDDAELNDLLTRYLNKHLPAFKTIQANDGFEAGRLLSEKRPGFVFLDINLPGIDGHGLCRKIKADPLFGKPFIIAMTGLDRPEEKETILADGADAFFAKPLDFESLVKTVEDLSAKVNAHNAD